MNNQTAEKHEPTEQEVPSRAKRQFKKSRVEHLLDSSAPRNKVDPFDEAESVDLSCAEKNGESPEPLKPKKIKLRRLSQKGLIRETLGLLFVALLIAGTWFNFTELNRYKNSVTTELNLSTQQLGSLTRSLEAVSEKIVTLERLIEQNRVAVEALQSDSASLQLMAEKIVVIGQEIEKLKEGSKETSESIISHEANIKRLQTHNGKRKLANKNNRRTQEPPKVVRTLKQPSKIVQLEGASLVSIDVWGSAVNAVLRSKDKWFPLVLGEQYKGWRFSDVQDNQALFTKNSKTIHLSIKE